MSATTTTSKAGAAPAAPTAVRDVVITNKLGIHARPSAAFVKLATRFSSEVWLEKDGELINGKSIMGLLMLAAGPGSRLRIRCVGPDAENALAALETLIRDKFGED